MKKTAIILIAAALATFLGSCANPITAYTAQKYYDYGAQAERGGDLTLAQLNFSRAYENSKMGNLGPRAEAYYLYELARVTGYVGSYAESEKAFLQVLSLIENAKGEADKLRAPALSEYARLLHDTGQHAKAVPIYQKVVPELERVWILSSDPLGFASLLDDYAGSLAAAGFSINQLKLRVGQPQLRSRTKELHPVLKLDDTRPSHTPQTTRTFEPRVRAETMRKQR